MPKQKHTNTNYRQYCKTPDKCVYFIILIITTNKVKSNFFYIHLENSIKRFAVFHRKLSYTFNVKTTFEMIRPKSEFS